MMPEMEQLRPSILRFVFTQVAVRHGRQWLGASRAPVPEGNSPSGLLPVLQEWEMPLDERLARRLAGVSNFRELLERNLLKGVRLDSHMGLWGMTAGTYSLCLRTDIPSAREMLDRQCRGERYVTYLREPQDLDKPVGRFAGSFEFLLHDLEHAHKFFGDPQSFRGQVAFFNMLRAVLSRFDEWSDDPLFRKDLDYLMSDMNSHTVHLYKYLKAIVLTAALRRGPDDKLKALWNQVLDDWAAPDPVREAALRINHPGVETRDDQIAVHDFFLGRFDSLSEAWKFEDHGR